MIGHALAGTWPDKTYNRAKLADQMAIGTYTQMQEFLNSQNMKPEFNWYDIKSQVHQFNRSTTNEGKKNALQN